MAEDPRVTVIVPVFEVESYIGQCIESVLSQTFQDIELILIDDHSSDSSYDICENYAGTDSRVRLFRNDENMGQGLTRNRGITLSRGEFVTFVDSDDYIDSNMSQRMVDLAETHGAEIVRCGFVKTLAREPEPVPLPQKSPVIMQGDRLREYLRGYFGALPHEALSDMPSMSPCTALYRGDLLRSGVVVFPSERIVSSEDLFFNLDYLSAVSTAVIVEEAFYYYYSRQGSTSRRYSSPSSKCLLLLERAGDDEELLLRVQRTILTAIKEAALQVAQEDRSFRESVRIVKQLEAELRAQSIATNYPKAELSVRERLFATMISRAWGWPEVLLARLYGKRVK